MNITQDQKNRAKQFQEMHKHKELFVLPTIWDAGGARIFEERGFEALATTSAGIAFANGFSDGEELPLNILLETVRRITNKIAVPLSVDFERGYGESEIEIFENTKQLVFAGAVGLNVEDGLPNNGISVPQLMKKKLAWMNKVKKELQINFVINARTDTYWNKIGDQKSRLAATIERANSYFSWGADCVFVPGNISIDELEILTEKVKGPINILLSQNLKAIDQLNTIGVKRVSIGSSLSRNSINNLFNESEKIRKNDFDSLLNITLPYDFVNQFYGIGEEEQ